MKEKILIINDDEAILELTQLVLNAKGFDIILANSGKNGIEKAIETNPQLILLDIMMPEMDGFETCKRLKESSVTKEIPILFFSSLTNPQDKIKGLELGAVDFINNVVDQGELLARVQTHLRIRSLTESLREFNEQLTRKQKILEDDLNAAAIIQRSFLPPSNFTLSNFELASVWLPASLLGGDIFNMIQCNEDQAIAYMVDVSGHDVPSALVTVSVSQFLHQLNVSTGTVLTPSQTLLALDKEYPLERFNRFFTIFYIVIDIRTGTFSYSCAGHPPAIVLSKKNGIQMLNRGGTIIGLNRSIPFDEGYGKLHPGDKVLLYTDGVIETMNTADELYGMERFNALLEEIKDQSVTEIVDKILASLNDFGIGLMSEDDRSMMCFQFNGE